MVDRHVIIGLSLLLLAACAPMNVTYVAPSQTGLLSGTVTYRERIALPNDAVVEVWIADVSSATLASPVIAESALLTDGKQVPLRFEVHFDPKRLDQGHLYAVRAVIRHNGEVLFSTEAPTPVLTQGNPSEVELVLSGVSPSSAG